MPYADADTKPEADQPLFLVSATIRNDYAKRWQPRVMTVSLTENVNGKPVSRVFRMDGRGSVWAEEEGQQDVFLLRFNATAAEAMFVGMSAMASAFPLHGHYFVPMYSAIAKAPPGVHYLGRIKAIIRERKDGEFRAGPLIPLIDQGIVGASSGTFDIEIVDAFDDDVPLFKRTFPALEGAMIARAILPPWDRQKIQKMWQNE
jgi:hypothetical protein